MKLLQYDAVSQETIMSENFMINENFSSILNMKKLEKAICSLLYIQFAVIVVSNEVYGDSELAFLTLASFHAFLSAGFPEFKIIGTAKYDFL